MKFLEMKSLLLTGLFLLIAGLKVFAFPAFQEADTLRTDTSFFNQVIGIFEEDDEDKTIQIQRSKRKQVDDLLKMILEQPGQLRFSGVATASVQTELNSNSPYWGVGSFDIFAFTSFGKNALLFFDLEAIGGNGPDPYIPNVSNLNADAGRTTSEDGIDRITLLEAWTEFKALKEIFTITLGKIDLTNYFDNNLHANDETSQFITGVFVNNPVLPVYFNSPGIRFRTTLFKRFYVQYGRAMADLNEIDLTKYHIQMLETGFKIFRESNWEANFRIFGFEHPEIKNKHGYGISYDQLMANTFTAFFRYGKNDGFLAEWQGILKAWSAGVGFKQTFLNREFNIGLGFAETYKFNDPVPERVAELYLSSQINKWVFFSPHFQWLQEPVKGVKDHYLGGLRLNFTY